MSHVPRNNAQYLVVVAHPDDELSCSSLLSSAAARQCNVNVITLTGAGTGREAEGRSSIGILFGNNCSDEKIEYCSWPDRRLPSVIPEMADLLSERLRSLSPWIVATHDPGDSHGDHRATYSAVEIASRYLPVSHITFGGPSVLPHNFQANYFSPLSSEQMQLKLAAAHAHHSQRHRPHMKTDYITGSANSWKYQYPFLAERGARFHEAFCIRRLESSLAALLRPP